MKVVLPAVPWWSWVEMKPGCCFMNAASSVHASMKGAASSGDTLNWLMRTTGPSSSWSCCRYVTWSSISRSGIAVLPSRAWSSVGFEPVAELTQHACRGREVRDRQPGGELVDPAGLPLVDGSEGL